MELYGFAKPTTPNLFSRQPVGTEYTIGRVITTAPAKQVQNAPDSRYPAYAAPMEDGRLVTDYRNHCSRNIPPGAQFSTKAWMIHHADNIINLSRERQAEWTGAALGTANTVPPPEFVVHSTPFDSNIYRTGFAAGIGLERADAKVPALFGTFVVPPSRAETALNKKNIALTSDYQGGRNSLRGSSVPASLFRSVGSGANIGPIYRA